MRCYPNNRALKAFAIGVWIISALLAHGTSAPATTLTFEDHSPGTTITAQYGPRGVIFPRGAYLDRDRNARSGTRVLRSANPAREHQPGPMIIEFTSPQYRVKLFAGMTVERERPLNGVLRARDGNGTVIAQVEKSVSPVGITTTFQVSLRRPLIRSVELEIGTAELEVIDDFEFEGDPPSEGPRVPPVVRITSPPNDTDVNSPIQIQGTVEGEGLLRQARLTITVPSPPGSTAPPTTSSLVLSGEGTSRSFSISYHLQSIGPIVIRVLAENTAGRTGSANVRVFANVPDAIRERYAREGGAPALGQIRYGFSQGSCTIVVYERAAIAQVQLVFGGRVMLTSTWRINSPILEKWESVRTSTGTPGELGCPTREEDPPWPPDNTRVQNFERGQIYADAAGVFYAPKVFVDAIARAKWGSTLREDYDAQKLRTLLPMEDPAKPLGVLETWLFQRFHAPGARTPRGDNLHTATLEIRGAHGMAPKLYMQRFGLGADLESAEKLNATVVEVFSCDQPVGDCDFSLPLEEPSLARPIRTPPTTQPPPPRDLSAVGDFPPLAGDQMGQYCKNTTWEAEGLPAIKRALVAGAVAAVASGIIISPLDPAPIAAALATALATLLGEDYVRLRDKLTAQWVPIRGDFIQTPVKGVVTSAHRAAWDNPFNHEDTSQCNILEIAETLSGEEACKSDDKMDVVPLRGWRSGLGGKDFVHMEWERKFIPSWRPADFDPGVFGINGIAHRDLVFVSGRWIVDCGHDWKTEIHPPSVVASMRQVPYRATNATVANVWVTGYYSGDEPIEFLVYPPPRPSPRATLNVVEEDYGITPPELKIDSQLWGNGVAVRISATQIRRPEVTSGHWFVAGNMKTLKDPERWRQRRFYVYWTVPRR